MRDEKQVRERLLQYEDVLKGLTEIHDRAMQSGDMVMVKETYGERQHCQQKVELIKWILEEI